MLQTKIFEKILDQHKNQAEALQQVSDLLFLNKSNVYRRFTEESALRPDEIETLVKHYKISLDEIVHQGSKQFLFSHSAFKRSGKQNHVTYSEEMKEQLLRALSIPDFKSQFLGYEIPTYHYSEFFPEILYFKSVQWKRLQWNTDKPFFIDLKQLSAEDKIPIKEACQAYNQLHTSEIWDVQGLDILLDQIAYTFNLRQISYEDAQFLFSGILDTMDLLEKKASKGSKLLDDNKNNFDLYYSEVPLSHYMFIEYNEHNPIISRLVTLSDSPNIITTTDISLIKKMYVTFQRVKNQSHKISETGERIRRKVFNQYRQKIRMAERQLKR